MIRIKLGAEGELVLEFLKLIFVILVFSFLLGFCLVPP